jgi:hypothetical protein
MRIILEQKMYAKLIDEAKARKISPRELGKEILVKHLS